MGMDPLGDLIQWVFPFAIPTMHPFAFSTTLKPHGAVKDYVHMVIKSNFVLMQGFFLLKTKNLYAKFNTKDFPTNMIFLSCKAKTGTD